MLLQNEGSRGMMYSRTTAPLNGAAKEQKNAKSRVLNRCLKSSQRHCAHTAQSVLLGMVGFNVIVMAGLLAVVSVLLLPRLAFVPFSVSFSAEPGDGKLWRPVRLLLLAVPCVGGMPHLFMHCTTAVPARRLSSV